MYPKGGGYRCTLTTRTPIHHHSNSCDATHPANEGEGLALRLVAQQRDALHEVRRQDEVLDAEHLVDVELRVDEGHAREVVVLQAPQEDLWEEDDREGGIGRSAKRIESPRWNHAMIKRLR